MPSFPEDLQEHVPLEGGLGPCSKTKWEGGMILSTSRAKHVRARRALQRLPRLFLTTDTAIELGKRETTGRREPKNNSERGDGWASAPHASHPRRPTETLALQMPETTPSAAPTVLPFGFPSILENDPLIDADAISISLRRGVSTTRTSSSLRMYPGRLLRRPWLSLTRAIVASFR
ncbi:hypothetical protein BKA70DRAFT_1270182 [Coprinopsis sp. MPI-PUGE-AT-0042]|nr:hypothetical protein BKA70DRAFT_1270182 [Coprinopsis sp. MPI-PUGE-AT-0042]